MQSTQLRLPGLSVETLPLRLVLNSQMKSFIGTTNMMPVRPSGEMGGVEQHRLHARKRVGHLGRNLCCAKSPVNCLAEDCNCPSSPVCCAFLQDPLKNVRFNLMLPFSPITGWLSSLLLINIWSQTAVTATIKLIPVCCILLFSVFYLLFR